MTATVTPAQSYRSGQRYKLTPKRLRQYLDHLRTGKGHYAASRAIGVDPRTIRRYQQADTEFHAAVLDAEAEFAEQVEDVLQEKALSGEQWAVVKWLESDRAQGRWLPPAVRSQLQVNVSGTVALEARLANVSELAERLEARRSELAALSGRPVTPAIETTARESQ